MKRKAIIVDLDNCIADDQWRRSHIHWDSEDPNWRFHDYHCLSAFDVLKNEHILDPKMGEIIISTGRPVMYRALTEEWLSRNMVPQSMIFMRPLGDSSKNVDVKRAALKRIFKMEKYEIVCAYDDLQEVIDMYKENGINAQKVVIDDTRE